MTDAVERAALLKMCREILDWWKGGILVEGEFRKWARTITGAQHMKDWDQLKVAQARLSEIAMDTLLASPAAEKAAVPDGWQLVPKEPTEAMVEETDWKRPLPNLFIREVYAAMLAAAPTPPVQPTDDLVSLPCDVRLKLANVMCGSTERKERKNVSLGV